MTTRGFDKPVRRSTAENVTGNCANSPYFSSAFMSCSPFLGTSLPLASRTSPMAVPAYTDFDSRSSSPADVVGAAGSATAAGVAGVAGAVGTISVTPTSGHAISTARLKYAVFMVALGSWGREESSVLNGGAGNSLDVTQPEIADSRRADEHRHCHSQDNLTVATGRNNWKRGGRQSLRRGSEEVHAGVNHATPEVSVQSGHANLRRAKHDRRDDDSVSPVCVDGRVAGLLPGARVRGDVSAEVAQRIRCDPPGRV